MLGAGGAWPLDLREEHSHIPGDDLIIPESPYHKGQGEERRHGSLSFPVYLSAQQWDKIPKSSHDISCEDSIYTGPDTKKQAAGA